MLLEQLEHWNTESTVWNTGTLKQPEQQKGGCGLCRENVWWLWTLRGKSMVIMDSIGKTYGSYGLMDSKGKTYGSYGLCREEVW